MSDFNIRRLIGSIPDLQDDEVEACYKAFYRERMRRSAKKNKPKVHFQAKEVDTAVIGDEVAKYSYSACGQTVLYQYFDGVEIMRSKAYAQSSKDTSKVTCKSCQRTHVFVEALEEQEEAGGR